MTRAHVTTIAVDADGRVTGVNYVIGSDEYFQPARAVLIAGYTYENARLLLTSTSPAFPNGLSNNLGQVGRHYFSHQQGAGVSALFPIDTNAWYGLPAQGVAVDNWADDNFDHADTAFIGGGNLWVMSDRRPISAASGSTWGRVARNWGSDWKAWIGENADRTSSAYIQKTTLSHEENFLDLDPTVRDPLGFPVIRITGQYRENEQGITSFVQDRMEEWYLEAGAIETSRGGSGGGSMGASTHAYGGTRMGDNPETNVVNRWGFSHEIPNLGVLGASVMGTSGRETPPSQCRPWRGGPPRTWPRTGHLSPAEAAGRLLPTRARSTRPYLGAAGSRFPPSPSNRPNTLYIPQTIPTRIRMAVSHRVAVSRKTRLKAGSSIE